MLKKANGVMNPPLVKRCQGAATKGWVAHISLQNQEKTNKNTWLEKVSDEVYLKDEK